MIESGEMLEFQSDKCRACYYRVVVSIREKPGRQTVTTYSLGSKFVLKKKWLVCIGKLSFKAINAVLAIIDGVIVDDLLFNALQYLISLATLVCSYCSTTSVSTHWTHCHVHATQYSIITMRSLVVDGDENSPVSQWKVPVKSKENRCQQWQYFRTYDPRTFAVSKGCCPSSFSCSCKKLSCKRLVCTFAGTFLNLVIWKCILRSTYTKTFPYRSQ